MMGTFDMCADFEEPEAIPDHQEEDFLDDDEDEDEENYHGE